MRRLVRNCGIVLFVVGLLVFLYPYYYRYRFEKRAELVIEEFIENEVEEYDELYEAMVAYNEELFLSRQSAMGLAKDYDTPDFEVDEEILGYVEIPAISVRLPIYNGAGNNNMAKGAVHLPYTSLPIGGVNTNTVIASHLSFKDVPMFRYLINLRVGDDIYVTNFWGTLHYRVVDSLVIYPDEYGSILIQEGRDLVTLSTCHPYPEDYQRYLVFGERVAD